MIYEYGREQREKWVYHLHGVPAELNQDFEQHGQDMQELPVSHLQKHKKLLYHQHPKRMIVGPIVDNLREFGLGGLKLDPAD